MATVNQNAIEELEARFSELETENSSLADQLAEVTQERDALKAELLRLKATLQVA